MHCRSCAMRPQCREICPQVERFLRRDHVYAREAPLDPALISKLASRGEQPWPGSDAEVPWLWDWVAPAVSRMPPRLALPFLLHYYDGVSITEITRGLRLHRSTVNRRLSRALTLVRQDVRERLSSGGDKRC